MAHSVGDCTDIVIYGSHYLLTFPLFDASGNVVTGAGSLDSEISLDLGTFTDCTNESSEIASASGVYSLYLTGAEMTGKIITVQVKSSSAKTAVFSIPTTRMQVLTTGTAQAGAAGTITLAASTSKVDNDFAGCYIRLSNNSPSGVQYATRKIISNVASTQVATVESNWGTNPSSSTTYEILIPVTVNVANLNVPFTSTFSDRLTINTTTTNTSAFNMTGNGSGSGFLATGGNTGYGIRATGGSSSGGGILGECTNVSSGNGIIGATAAAGWYGIYALATGASGIGFRAEGGAGGTGIFALVASGNGSALSLAGSGTGNGLLSTGGATGIGGKFVGGATSGVAISLTTTSGDGLSITPTAGNAITASGAIIANNASNNITGIDVKKWLGGTIPAVNVTGVPLVDASYILGTAISTPATAGILDVNVKRVNNVTSATPGASGGLLIAGANAGTTTLAALTVTGTFTISDGLSIARSTSNASAIVAIGNGTGSGATFTSGSGATGDGVKMVAASTVGNGLTLTGTSTGYDFNLSTPDTNLPGGGAPPTVAAIATAVWTDVTGSDFTTVSSIGKALYPDGSGYTSINVKSINSSTNAAVNQQAALDVLYRGTITGGATTTTLISSNLSQALADLWKGRVVIFLSGNLVYRATQVTAFDPALDQLTFNAIGGTPINGDLFVIL